MKRLVISIVLLAVLTPIFAGESDPAEELIRLSDSPQYLEPRDDSAVLFLVSNETWVGRGFLKKKAVFLDDEPLGYLAGNSYLVAEVEPGLRGLLTGIQGHDKDWHWIDLKPGRSYILFLQTHQEQVYSPIQQPGALEQTKRPGAPSDYRLEVTLRWWLSWPRDVRELVESLELRQVTTTEAGMAALRAKDWGTKATKKTSKKQEKKQKTIDEIRDLARVELPLMEEDKLSCKMVEERLVFKRGRLTIDFMELVWQSKSKRIEIPIAEILRVESLEHEILIGYGDLDDMRTLVLYAGANEAYERILLHLLEAMETTAEPSDLPG